MGVEKKRKKEIVSKLSFRIVAKDHTGAQVNVLVETLVLVGVGNVEGLARAGHMACNANIDAEPNVLGLGCLARILV